MKAGDARLDYVIRQMVEADLPVVAEVEAGVFTDWYRIYRREPDPLSERTLDELRYSTSLNPDANSVAVAADGSLVGFILARTWGRVGWFGTFGVPTQFQRLGIGSALVNRTVDYLSARTDIIGLETMPESGANIALYSRAGFVATYPTIILELSLIREADRLKGVGPDEATAYSSQDDSSRERLVEESRAVSDALLPGLDYSREIEAISANRFGDTFFSCGAGERLDGFAILRTAPFRHNDKSGRGYIHVMAIRPGAPTAGVLADLLRQIWATATQRGLSRLTTGLSTRNQAAVRLMLDAGFRSIRAAIRMVHLPASPEFFQPTDVFDVARWVG